MKSRLMIVSTPSAKTDAWHVLLPPLETFTPADLREGRGSTAIIRNNAFHEAGKAIEAAGGTYSHAEPPEPLRLVDNFVVFPKDWPPDW